RIHKDNLTTSTFSLVREKFLEDAPATIQDALAEVLVADHVVDFQIFQRDTIIALYQRIGELVQVVPTLVSDKFLLSLYGTEGFLPVLATTLGAGQLALFAAQISLCLAVVLWVIHPVA